MRDAVPRRQVLQVAACMLTTAVLFGGALAEAQSGAAALAKARSPTLLAGRRTDVTLLLDKDKAARLAAGQRIHLVIRGLSVATAPGVIYQIYLNLPKDVSPAANDPRYVGALNFFNAVTPDAARPPVMQSFDVTGPLRGGGRALTGDQTIAFITAQDPAPDSRPRVESIELRSD